MSNDEVGLIREAVNSLRNERKALDDRLNNLSELYRMVELSEIYVSSTLSRKKTENLTAFIDAFIYDDEIVEAVKKYPNFLNGLMNAMVERNHSDVNFYWFRFFDCFGFEAFERKKIVDLYWLVKDSEPNTPQEVLFLKDLRDYVASLNDRAQAIYSK